MITLKVCFVIAKKKRAAKELMITLKVCLCLVIEETGSEGIIFSVDFLSF